MSGPGGAWLINMRLIRAGGPGRAMLLSPPLGLVASLGAFSLPDSRLLRGPAPYENLTTLAPNLYGATAYYDSFLHEVFAENAQALYLALTGLFLTVDTAITAGHKHATATSQIRWMQRGSVLFHNNEASTVNTAPNQAYDALLINSASTVECGKTSLWLSILDAATVIFRVRVSNDNSATNTTTITLACKPNTDSTATTTATATIVFTTAALRDRQWLVSSPVDLSSITPDATHTGMISVAVEVTAIQTAATEAVALHELQHGVE